MTDAIVFVPFGFLAFLGLWRLCVAVAEEVEREQGRRVSEERLRREFHA